MLQFSGNGIITFEPAAVGFDVVSFSYFTADCSSLTSPSFCCWVSEGRGRPGAFGISCRVRVVLPVAFYNVKTRANRGGGAPFPHRSVPGNLELIGRYSFCSNFGKQYLLLVFKVMEYNLENQVLRFLHLCRWTSWFYSLIMNKSCPVPVISCCKRLFSM